MVELEVAKERFLKRREEIKQKHFEKKTGFEIAQELKDSLDELLTSVYPHFFGKWDIPATLVALGGYGRGELNFYSDMDFNLIYKGKLTDSYREDLEAFYYYMLSFNIDLGYSPRNLDEAVSLAQEDLSVLTNFLQIRYVAGDERIVGEFGKRFWKFLKKNRENIIDEIIKARNERYKRFFGTVYYQEPNVKESKGGLRDLHEAFWIAKIVFEIDNYSGFIDKSILDWKSFRDVISAYDFLLRVRNHLHILSGRKSDILSFQLQREVAKFFGFSSDNKGVENFMKNYFSAALDLSIITREIIKKSREFARKTEKTIFSVFKKENRLNDYFYEHDGTLYIFDDKKTEVLKNPSLILDGFKFIQQIGYTLSSDAFSIFKLSAETEKEAFQQKAVLKKFKDILLKPVRLSYVIELMHDCRVLDTLIPDFERLRGHFQFDTYHKFTTDIHLIMTVRELEKLKENSSYYQILDDLEKPHTLFIAALLHDIGKGKKGKHENVGAAIAYRYLKRLDFKDDEIEEIVWLIKNHLLMSFLAFRRDISDPKLIEEFVKNCETEERLKKLFLLTCADIKAVGPGGWDRWKASLLWELFTSALDVFYAGKDVKTLINEKVKKKAEKVKELLKDDTDKKLLERLFESAEEDYLRTYSADDIVKHLKLIKRLMDEGKDILLISEFFPELGYAEVTVVDRYKRAFFYKIAGVFTYLNLNIKGAYINKAVTVDETDFMVYTVRVSTVSEEVPEEEVIEKVKDYVRELYYGKIEIENILKQPFKRKGFRSNLPKPVTKVKFDNSISEKYTVVEVSTWDRLGLLYAITRELALSGTKLRRAIISTEGNRVIDSFYITDLNLNKISDEEKLEEIKVRILNLLKDK
ncbi:[protein-PII] uridylyltransferase [Desulfurobacterium atlanticum]|uniref:Bifunctional uridylyltransferase/uridylyl-removing enzyme n=1 Tax=Desulfurobacterium atlanticum TaxID=240169 RepID=A0A238Z298_9BACT|nr:[protein-PII] uridylyltransferase [Desulfurobacterium atlanticum]SNR77460.1 UTP--GlnB (protein PII) uridylyltransferase, GlnD [Desulfurobacterium atlanticum]